MRPAFRTAALLAFLILHSGLASGLERFPPPDFDSGHELPPTTVPPPSATSYEYLDVILLAVALGSASYLALKRRSRNLLFGLMLFSLAYFGFWRKGCVCPIGAVQNVTLALFERGYAPPFAVLAFFLLPLVSALLFGRVFCGSVCPIGAVQDVFVLRPLKVPGWLEHSLGLLAYVYLGLAVLLAATGSAFVVCRYDPFVSLFRLSGSTNMLILGASFLLLAVFVARPYCRYVCPYGALLRLFSRASRWHLTITPDECINCRLCEEACPFGAILRPNRDEPLPDRREGMGRLSALLVLLPVLTAFGVWLGARLAPPLSRVHATVRLAERVRSEEDGLVKGTTDASDAYRRTGRRNEELYAEAGAIKFRFLWGGRLLGAWVGLVVGGKLVSLAVRRARADHEPDRSKCISCGRCFGYCPRERARLKRLDGERQFPRRAPEPRAQESAVVSDGNGTAS